MTGRGATEVEDDSPYQASPIKRKRRTKAEVAALDEAIYAIAEENQPATVRQIYYRLVSAGAIVKTENEYDNIGRRLGILRRARVLPFGWIADNTRWQRKPDTYSGLRQALIDTARFYRRAVWNDLPVYCEVWLEKDALAGVLYDVTAEYDVPLMVTRGYASLSYIYEAAEAIAHRGKPTHIYYFGDHDPSGININALRDIAIACDAAVIVTAHPSLSGRASGTGEAGSTAWHNTVRSRLYLKNPPDEEDDDLRILATMKANYGRKGREIRLRWTDGVFINIDGPSTGVIASIARRNADEVFMTLLGELDAQGRPVSENPHARNFAPRIFAKHPGRQGFTRKDFEFSMERLFADGRIRIEEYGRKSDMRRRIVSVNPNPKGEDDERSV